MAMTSSKAKPRQDDVEPLSSAELVEQDSYEFIIIGGPDGSGKTCALVSLCWYIEQINPDATCYVGDTEKKFRSALKSFGKDRPNNIVYFPLDDMNQITSTMEKVIARHKSGDWFLIESLDRIWEKAQDLATLTIAGVTKAEYLERKVGEKLPTGITRKDSPIPQPEDYWKIAKGAHDGAFIDLLTDYHFSSLNVIATTTIARPKQERGNRPESADRKAARIELGISANLNGAPRLPYYPETMCLFDLKAGKVTCQVLRDNLSSRGEESRFDFEVSNYKSWGMEFISQCRG